MNSSIVSWKTTLGGALLALGGPLSQSDTPWVAALGSILVVAGPILLGFSARDANKSSQDQKIR